MPKVSVIIPVYNVEKYLRQCLNSVINQTLKDIEIICVDDGSTDRSLNILEEYKKKDNRIIVIKQQNQYAGVARNNGLKVATGEYLSFLDSDDFFEHTMLEEMYNKAKKDDSDIVICGWKTYSQLTEASRIKLINEKFVKISPFSLKKIPSYLFGIVKPNPWSKLFKHSLFKEYNLEFDNTICFNDFTCVITAIAAANKISILNKPFISYRVNQSTNLTSKTHKKYGLEADLAVMVSLYNNLKRLDLYDLYQNPFENHLVKTFSQSIYLNRKEEIKKGLSKELFEILNKKGGI